ncbi:MAG: M23 family metallopeptidase [Gemmatimonadaceae bacterium]
MTAPSSALFLDLGRELTLAFYGSELDSLWSGLVSPLHELFGSPRGLADFRAEVESHMGRELRVVTETVTPWLGSTIYNRIAEFERFRKPVLIQWAFDPDGRAQGLMVTPVPEAGSTRALEHRTRTDLRLPFDDEWFVFWGGRDVVDNAHAITRDQRFACDFVVVRGDGRGTHEGDGTENEQYFCFGQRVVAPAQGVVVAAEDGIADNRPGVMNARTPLGNHVIIDHSNSEYSFIAHLRNGTVAVRKGDVVRAGDLLGQCGNSGNSSEPHIHYHLQTKPRFGKGEGLPAQFLDYRADSVLVERGEPRRGQRVCRTL